MPPKLKPDDLIEALSDTRVAEALARALSPYITKSIDEYVSRKLDNLESQLETLKRENVELRSRSSIQDKRIEELDSYSRADNLIVRGLPERSSAERATGGLVMDSSITNADTHQSVENTFISFCSEKLNITVNSSDISVAHRLKPSSNDSVRPLIVRFTNRRVRNLVFMAKKKLKDTQRDGNRVFISEHLTKNASELFFQARKMVREKRIHSAWTQNCKVYVKFSADPTARPIIIHRREDMNRSP